MMETFETYRVALVSVTQQFNSATSMGRLILNVLLSFAQFEREIIAERTRDKIAATRRKGKWAGGQLLLGFDAGRRPGIGGTRLDDQVLADTQGTTARRPALHQDQPAPAAEQRPLPRQGPLPRRGPPGRAPPDRGRRGLPAGSAGAGRQ